MKKLKLCALFAAALVALLIMAVPSFAAVDWTDPAPDGDYDALQLDKPVATTINNYETILTYKFTPSTSANYIFTTEDTENTRYDEEEEEYVCADTQGRLLEYKDGSFNQLEYNDDGDYDVHFQLSHDLKAGKTYYLQIRLYSARHVDNEFQIIVKKNPIKKITYLPFNKYTVKQYTNCYEGESGYIYRIPGIKQGDVLIIEGYDADDITAYTYKQFYDEDDDYYYYEFVSDDNELLPGYVSLYSDQNNTPWEIGDKNVYYADYKGVTCKVFATVIPFEIESISLSPAAPYTLAEEEDGEWEGEGENKWFRYYYPSFNSNDILTLTLPNGNTEEYRYDRDDDCFYLYDDIAHEINTSQYIDPAVFQYSSDQATNHWLANNDYSFTVSFLGKTCTLPVTIKENEIASIEFEKADGTASYEFNEFDTENGYWTSNDEETWYFRYNTGFQVGDKLTVNYIDETSKTYVWTQSYDEDEGEYYYHFVDSDNNTLDNDYVEFLEIPNQVREHWVGGNTYGVNILYRSRSLAEPIPVVINAASLSDIIAEANALLESYDSLNAIMYYRDSWNYFMDCKEALIDELDKDEHTSSSISICMYELKDAYENLEPRDDAFIPFDPDAVESIEPGDSKNVYLSSAANNVTYKFECTKDGVYTFQSKQADGDSSYDTYGHILVYDEETGEYEVFDDDDDDGDDNNFLMNFDGKAGTTYWLQAKMLYSEEEGNVVISLEKDPVESVSFVCKNDRIYEQFTHGEYAEKDRYVYGFDIEEGDKLVYKYDDGTTAKYTYKPVTDDYDNTEYYFVNDDNAVDMLTSYSIDAESDQDDKHIWGLGEHEFNLNYYDYNTRKSYDIPVPVTIVENTVTDIEFEPADPYVFNQNDTENGYLDDYSEPPFFVYNTGFRTGDTLSVYRGEGEDPDVFVFDEDDYYFHCAETGDKIYPDQLLYNDHQNESHWMPNKDNYVTITYAGKSTDVMVTIISDGSEEAAREQAVTDAKTLLDSVKGYKEEDYTASSYAAFADAKEALEEAIAEGSTADSSTIIKATEELSNKAGALVNRKADLIKKAKLWLLSVRDLDPDDYTEASYTPFAAAKQTLEEAIADESAVDADAVEAALFEFKAKKDNLVTKEDAADEEAARAAAVTAAEELLNSQNIKDAVAAETEYSESTFKTFSDAKKALEDAIKEDSGKTADEIYSAISALNSAYAGLKTPAQEEAEKEAAARAEAVGNATTLLNSDKIKNAASSESEYTESTFKAFSDAKKALEDAIKDDSGKTSADINNAIAALNSAYANLKTKLDEAKENAQALLNSDKVKNIAANSGRYTEDTYHAFDEAKTALENAIKEGSGKTAEQIYQAVADLNTAISNLKLTDEGEAEARAEAITNANTLLNSADIKTALTAQDTYTESSFKAFTDAKAALEAAIVDETKTSVDINNAIDALNDAFGKLKTKAEEDAEKEAEARAAAVTEANALLTSDSVKNAEAAQTEYSEESYKAFADSKAALENAVKDSSKTSADISKLINALKDALKGLVKESDAKAAAVVAANAAIESADSVVTTKYQTSTVTPFKEALAKLKTILENPDAVTSGYINTAVDKLTAAQAALKLKLKNPVVVKARKKTITIKAKDIKSKNKTIKKKTAFKITKRKTKLTFKMFKKAKKAGKKITISKAGKITVKRGLKKGKYTMTFKVTAASNGTYKKGFRKVKLTIKVR